MDGNGGNESAAMLRALAGDWPTPAYVYELDRVFHRLDLLEHSFAGRFEISYAVKANPNRTLLAAIGTKCKWFDVSSLAEAQRVREAGLDAPLSFTGPGKRDEEIAQFTALGGGYIVLESLDEAETLSSQVQAQGLATQPVLLRINPLRTPRQFGASMASRSSQFGIDEEDLAGVLAELGRMPGIALVGFHCYAANNGLNAVAVADNFAMMAELFRACASLAAIAPQVLIFGAGFGIPYGDADAELDLAAVAASVNPLLDALSDTPGFGQARFVLELGRWIVGPAGHLLTSVVRTKDSRGNAIRICDAGFNANMAACGMLGGTFKRNWRIANLTNPDGVPETVDLVGPLCTSLDRVATAITLPQVRKGDILAIAHSGAYGVTASPTRFISHPEPIELILHGNQVRDATESWANRPAAT